MDQLSFSTFKKSMENLFENFVEKSFLLTVSGGVDSMVLAHLFADSGINFQIAHINYKLRGKDSDDDAKLVKDFCDKNQIKIHLYEVSEKDEKPGGSIQLWARELRYKFFREIQETENLEYLVTAHHLNDQLETFLINLSRGSGIKGLSGIPNNENHVLRPLLNFSKEEIYRFAKECNIDFREDSSNLKNDYLRNKIRNKIVPELLETNESFLDNFNKSLKILSQTKDFIENEISKKIDDYKTEKSGQIILNKKKIAAESPLVQYEIFSRFDFDEKQIEKILSAATGSKFYIADFTLAVNRDELIIEKKSSGRITEPDQIELKIDSKNEVIFPKKIRDELGEAKINWDFDLDKVSFPLILRHKKEGDFFYPLGMTGKKKVSKFFKDEKISILAKPKIWLLCDGNDEILGILPYRQDRRCAADATTHDILKIKI